MLSRIGHAICRKGQSRRIEQVVALCTCPSRFLVKESTVESIALFDGVEHADAQQTDCLGFDKRDKILGGTSLMLLLERR